MKTRLKILCGLFTVAYLYVIINAIVTTFIPSFIAGVNHGYSSTKEKTEHRDFSQSKEIRVKVVPENGIYSFPTPMINKKTGETVYVECDNLNIQLNGDGNRLPTHLVILDVVVLLLALFLAFILVYVPILSYKIVRSIIKDEIFDDNNIRRLRLIGYLILVVFVITLFAGFIWKMTGEYLVSLEGYRIVLPIDTDALFSLVFGILILIFAEILKIATYIKEEQDLTV